MLELGRVTPRHFRGKRHDRRALLDCEAQWLSLCPVRRFPPPWSVEEQAARFVVRDQSGQQLAYVYFDDEPGRRSASTRVESKSDDPGGDVRSHHQRAVGWEFGGRGSSGPQQKRFK
jgi:hypothetical protein